MQMNQRHWSLLLEGIESCLGKVCFKVLSESVLTTEIWWIWHL